uniref:Large ribosomal subunit protein bL32c n=1 Tax=Hypertelis spergulacea TaxID=764270 RepID=A0A411L8W7_9CARY|nr:ribosomal protein L32 [Hypertelis spergulacea]
MAVPKKRTSLSKKRIRKTLWKKKGYWAALKAFSLAKSLSTGNSKSFVGQLFGRKRTNQILEYKPKGFGDENKKK